MVRHFLLCSAVLAACSLIGCATQPKAVSADQPFASDLSGLTRYYEEATAPHRRAVRKPIRDQRALALRLLAREADKVLADTQPGGSDVRLAALAEGENPTARDALVAFRTSLADLRAAATSSDLAAVRQQYPCVVASYSRLNEAARPTN